MTRAARGGAPRRERALGAPVFRDEVPGSTWTGLAIILCGSLVIHFGRGSG